jgi:hypothetical protein
LFPRSASLRRLGGEIRDVHVAARHHGNTERARHRNRRAGRRGGDGDFGTEATSLSPDTRDIHGHTIGGDAAERDDQEHLVGEVNVDISQGDPREHGRIADHDLHRAGFVRVRSGDAPQDRKFLSVGGTRPRVAQGFVASGDKKRCAKCRRHPDRIAARKEAKAAHSDYYGPAAFATKAAIGNCSNRSGLTAQAGAGYDFDVKISVIIIGVAILLSSPIAFAQAPGSSSAKRPPAADRPKRSTKPAASAPAATKGTGSLLKKFRSAMADGDLARAGGILSAARKTLVETKAAASDEDTARWLLCEAELELARGRATKAGLAALRVVVLRPRTDEAAEGLYWAARAYEKLQRGDKAADLYRECLEQKRLAASIHKKAQDRLTALDKKDDSR